MARKWHPHEPLACRFTQILPHSQDAPGKARARIMRFGCLPSDWMPLLVTLVSSRPVTTSLPHSGFTRACNQHTKQRRSATATSRSKMLKCVKNRRLQLSVTSGTGSSSRRRGSFRPSLHRWCLDPLLTGI